MTLEITAENYERFVLNNPKPILLDFWGPHCGPCHQLSPHLEELAEEYQGRIIIGKVNVDENPDLLLNFKIRGIPTILYLKNGVVVNRLIGYSSKKTLEDKLKKFLLDA